ncbi:MAG: HAMP domain-containing protein, partial [Anaerolineales bacterium]
MKDERGVVLGVLRLHYNATVLTQLMVKNRELAGPSSFAVLVDEYGIILAHGDNSAANFRTLAPLPEQQVRTLQFYGRLPQGTSEQLSLNLSALVPLLQKGNQEPITSEIHPVEAQHSEVIIAQPLKTLPWTLFYAQNKRSFSTLLHRQSLLFSGMSILVGVVVIAVAFALSNRISQPLTALTQAAHKVRQGDFSVQVNLQSRDESEVLADAFNTMTRQIRELVSSLEARVAERTRHLEERSLLLQHAAEFGKIIASTLDPQQLVEQAVNLIQERFGLYYVGLFELDGSGEWAVLQAGSGEAGRKMLARGHRIRVGTGMIGWC